MQRFASHSVQDTEKIAAKLAEKLKGGEVIAFTGSMGMGKTAFTRGLVLALGGGDVVSSPTFALVNEYRRGARPVFHFDMYRIEDDDELYSSGFYDYESRGGYCLAEWCENIPWALPADRIRAEISKTGNTDERRITVEHINEKENVK